MTTLNEARRALLELKDYSYHPSSESGIMESLDVIGNYLDSLVPLNIEKSHTPGERITAAEFHALYGSFDRKKVDATTIVGKFHLRQTLNVNADFGKSASDQRPAIVRASAAAFGVLPNGDIDQAVATAYTGNFREVDGIKVLTDIKAIEASLMDNANVPSESVQLAAELLISQRHFDMTTVAINCHNISRPFGLTNLAPCDCEHHKAYRAKWGDDA